MKKVICCPKSNLPKTLEEEAVYFLLYSKPVSDAAVGHIAIDLLKDIERSGLKPSIEAIDFLTFALSVTAADKAILRNQSADGWTRKIELHIYLQNPEVWVAKREYLETTLRFLTGDFWSLHFLQSGTIESPKCRKKRELCLADCVCLLSGGVDSLVGAIDLIANGKKPYFVSQISKGSAAAQRNFAYILGAEQRHFQWSCRIKSPVPGEPSTRSRSIVFFALAILAASAVESVNGNPVDIYVPENGFISLNIPLGPMRVGSLSTKTTHPVYLAGLQSLWNSLGINARLVQPYRFKTKGEMLIECADRKTLSDLLPQSISCGKFGRPKLHCGTCIPCLVRRSAFLKAGITDLTVKGYLDDILPSTSSDIFAALYAFLQYQREGTKNLLRGNLLFAGENERMQYEDVFTRSMDEVGAFLKLQGVI